MVIASIERKQYLKLKYNKYERKNIIFETITGWAFLSPLLMLAIIFSTSALGIAIWITFQTGQSLNTLKYVGFQNWKLLFNPSLKMGLAFINTFKYAIVSVPAIVITSLIISVILNSKWLKGRRVFLAIFFLPQITSAIASTLVFKQLFSANGFIKLNYIENPSLIIWVIVISAVWGGVAGSLITYNTAFATIDRNQYDAADLDGASGYRKFAKVTIPSISPIIAYSLIMGIIGGFGVFDGPYLFAMTTGVNPSGLTTLMFKGFNYIIPVSAATRVNMGLGTTIIFVTAMVIAAATFIGNLFFPMSKQTH